MWEALHFEFMRNALAAGVFVSIACGVVGTLVVVNRMVFISGGIAHAAYGGIGMALYFGLSPLVGAGAFSVGSSLIMGAVSLKSRHRTDTIIGVLWAVGMAMGVIFVDLTPGYHVDLMSYLFGSILAVPKSDLWFMFPLDLVIILVVLFFFKEFQVISYDDEFARVRGIPVNALYLLLFCMIGFSVVMIIRIVGLILVIALLSIPPYIAEKVTDSLGKMMVLSSLFGIFFTVTGLWISYRFNLTSGAAIILVAGAGFFLTLAIDRFSGPDQPQNAEA
ncbi:MAG TPA: metal ABC transporter permease [Desulfobacteraceae bacterium]|nr:metal ABC transporter permease [Desulfobacteraceae bacterium]